MWTICLKLRGDCHIVEQYVIRLSLRTSRSARMLPSSAIRTSPAYRIIPEQGRGAGLHRCHMRDLPGVSRSSIYGVTGLGNKVPRHNLVRNSGRSLMSIVGALDVHRRQLTFEYLDAVNGELQRGRVIPADRPHLRAG
jgi:hypothetical protein